MIRRALALFPVAFVLFALAPSLAVASASPGQALVVITPCRALDTRNAAGPLGGPALAASEIRILTVVGACGVPANALGLAVNITVVQPASSGFARLYAGDAATPPTSVLSFNAGVTRAGNAMVALASDISGTVAPENASPGAAHYIIDVAGYWVPACNAPAFSTTNVNPLCNGDATGSITFIASGGTGTLSYSVNGGVTFQASNVFPGLAAGSYGLMVQDSVGCSMSGTATLTAPPLVAFTTTNVNPSPAGSSTGSITFNASGGTGALSYSINGGSSFQASNAFSGLAAGTYNLVVKDANGCTKTGTATLTDTPVAVNDSYGTPVGTALRVFEVRVHVVDNDYTDTGIGGSHLDPTIHVGDTVTWVWDQGTHTSTSSNPTEVWDSGSLTVGQTFSHAFTTVGDFAYGSSGEPSMTGTVHVLAGLRLGVLGNDTLNGAAITSYGPSVGNEQTTIGAPTPSSAGGTVTLYASGGFLYAPPSAVFTGSDTFKYILANGAGSSTGTVTITVLNPPAAADDAYQTAKNAAFPQPAPGVLGNDTLNTATIFSYGATTGGEQTSIGSATPTSAGGSVTLNADGSFSFTPLAGFTGSDTFKYVVKNITGPSTATVTFTVVTAPAAVDDGYLAGRNTPLSVVAAQGVTTNDTLSGATILSYGATTGGEQTSIGSPTPTSAGGSVTLNADGSFTFTPFAGFTGSDTFKYVLKNAAGTSTATVTVNVVPPPVAVADAYSVPSNTTTTKNAASGVLPNDTVNSASIVSYGATTGNEQASIGSATPTSAGGTITLNADGSFSYTPLAAFTGTDTFKYKLQNPAGSSTATATFTVLNPPSAVNDSHAVTGNVAIAPAAPGVLGNDSGSSTSVISYGATTGGEQITIGASTPTSQGGTVALNANGSYSYSPPANFTGTDTFKYRIDNALGLPSTGTVTLSVSSRILFVSSGGVGNCKPATPCALSTAGGAAAVSSGKDLIFALSGSYGGASITLKAGQSIVGQQVSFAQALADAGLALAADSESIVIGASSAPTFSNAGNVITLGGGNLVEYLTISPSTGAGISGNGAVTGTTTVNGVVLSPSGSANGVSLTSQAALHTFAFNSGSITSSSSGAAVLMGGASGAGPATFSISVASSSGKPVDISSRIAGTVAFNRAVSGTGQGVSLTNNTGSTINFSGGISLSTGANAAFTAAGGGTINTSGTNSVATTTGTAVSLSNVGGTLSFTSISTNGAATGISLTNTAGTFTVTGDGSGMANGSGGSISNAATEAVHMLAATGTVTLKSMNLSLNTSAVDGMLVDNNAGGTLTVNVIGCTYTGVTGSVSQSRSLLQFEGGGAANVTANVQNSFFNGSRTYGFFATAAGTSIMSVTLNQSGFGTDVNTGAAVDNPGTAITNPPAFAVGITNGGGAQVDYVVSGNTFWGADGLLGAIYAVTISGATTTGASHLNGSFSNNRIGKAGVGGSGCANGCAGLGLLPGTSGQFKATVTNNDIRQVNSLGMQFFNSAGAGATIAVTAKVKGNTFDEPDTTGSPLFQRAIVVSPGNSGGASEPTCAEIGGTLPGEPNVINGAWQTGNFIRVTNNNNTQPIVLPGLTPASGATAAQVNAFVQANNTMAAGSVNAALGTAGINGGSPCP